MVVEVADKTMEEAKNVSMNILDEVFGPAVGETVGVQLWDGKLWPDERPRPVQLVLKHPGALRNMLLPGTEVALAEAYLYDDLDITGDVTQVFALVEPVQIATAGFRKKIRVARDLLRLPDQPSPGGNGHQSQRGPAHLSGKQHSIERDRQAVRYHYDVSNDFYQLYLDQRMIYSCAFFRSPEDDLDKAQANKLEIICRKLRLKPGQRMLDIGCGWGGLILYAARNYGVDATGITLSQPQADLANRRIADAGLANRCRVIVQDYREVQTQEPYDVLVSVGMFEHVGKSLLPTYFKKAWSLLKPRGVFLNHGIAQRATNPPDPQPNFSDNYVFPDGETLPINITLHAAEEEGFEVRDVESWREHYALTLQHWIKRLEAHHTEALQYVDEPTYRVWRLYMAGSCYGFKVGRLNLYQSLLVKQDESGVSGLPMTREDWYR